MLALCHEEEWFPFLFESLKPRLHSSFLSFTALTSSGAPVSTSLTYMFSLTSLAAIGWSLSCSLPCF